MKHGTCPHQDAQSLVHYSSALLLLLPVLLLRSSSGHFASAAVMVVGAQEALVEATEEQISAAVPKQRARQQLKVPELAAEGVRAKPPAEGARRLQGPLHGQHTPLPRRSPAAAAAAAEVCRNKCYARRIKTMTTTITTTEAAEQWLTYLHEWWLQLQPPPLLLCPARRGGEAHSPAGGGGGGLHAAQQHAEGAGEEPLHDPQGDEALDNNKQIDILTERNTLISTQHTHTHTHAHAHTRTEQMLETGNGGTRLKPQNRLRPSPPAGRAGTAAGSACRARCR
jgi:hypothetical protein